MVLSRVLRYGVNLCEGVTLVMVLTFECKKFSNFWAGHTFKTPTD